MGKGLGQNLEEPPDWSFEGPLFLEDAEAAFSIEKVASKEREAKATASKSIQKD